MPWAEARRDRLAPKDLSPKIDRVGLLPLDVDAAVQQAIWRGDSPLHEILARHGLDEITWRDHLRRRGEALRDEAQQGSSDRAAAARSALDRAREPTASPPEPELDLQRYATLRALLADSGDENAILAAHGVPREVWDREHRAYRKRLRSDPDLAERFKAALEEAKGHARSPAPAAPSKKKTIAKKPRSGAQAAGKNGPARARSTAPPPGEKEPGAARSRPA